MTSDNAATAKIADGDGCGGEQLGRVDLRVHA